MDEHGASKFLLPVPVGIYSKLQMVDLSFYLHFFIPVFCPLLTPFGLLALSYPMTALVMVINKFYAVILSKGHSFLCIFS